MRKLCAVILSAVVWLVAAGTPASAAEHQSTLSAGYLQTHTDMPAGRGHMTLEFSVSAWLVNDWYPTASISDLLVVVMKKATASISIS